MTQVKDVLRLERENETVTANVAGKGDASAPEDSPRGTKRLAAARASKLARAEAEAYADVQVNAP